MNSENISPGSNIIPPPPGLVPIITERLFEARIQLHLQELRKRQEAIDEKLRVERILKKRKIRI